MIYNQRLCRGGFSFGFEKLLASIEKIVSMSPLSPLLISAFYHALDPSPNF
jgi:hypothetical protein